MFVDIGKTFCPFHGTTAIWKAFLSNMIMSIFMLAMLLIAYATVRLFGKRKYKVRKNITTSVSFIGRLEACYLRVLMFSYKNITTLCFLSLNYIFVKDRYVLFIQGTITCWKTWQYLSMTVVALWVTPFPFALSYTYKRNIEISKFHFTMPWYV